MQTSSSLPDDGQRKNRAAASLNRYAGSGYDRNKSDYGSFVTTLPNKVTRRLTATDDARTNARIAATEKILDRLNVPLILPASQQHAGPHVG